jgi:hypothetical protein
MAAGDPGWSDAIFQTVPYGNRKEDPAKNEESGPKGVYN